jgi:hypothetical protein
MSTLTALSHTIEQHTTIVANGPGCRDSVHREDSVSRKGMLTDAPVMSNIHLGRWVPVTVTVIDTTARSSDPNGEPDDNYRMAERKVRLSGPPARKDGRPMLHRSPVVYEWRFVTYDTGPGKLQEDYPGWLAEHVEAWAGPMPTLPPEGTS